MVKTFPQRSIIFTRMIRTLSKNSSRWVKDVVPDLEYLRTDYTQTRQMGLFMQERGFGSQWYAEELSDGTLMSIALFLAILDSRYSCVFIEEPENSLHPWILRTFLEEMLSPL